MAKGKTRANPFIGHTPQGNRTQSPALVSWTWKLAGIVPGGKDLSFELLSCRPGIFRPLLAGLWSRSIDQVPPKSHAGIGHERLYLYKFEKFLSTHCELRIRELSSLHELRRETLVEYRSWLYGSIPSNQARRTYRGLIHSLLILQGESSPIPKALHPELEIPRTALRPAGHGSTAVSPYTRDEQDAIETVCKQAIKCTIERLNKGKVLLSQGKDPRTNGSPLGRRGRILKYSTGWESIPNVLWYIVNVLDGRMPSARKVGDTRADLVNFLLGDRAPILKKQAYDLLYLHSVDIVPFIALLSLKTGLNAESVMTLERDCLQGTEGGMTWVKYRKTRGSHEVLKRKFSHRGPNSPVGVIKVVLQLTEGLVKLAAPDVKKYLWLCHLLKQGQQDGSRYEMTNKADILDISHVNMLLNGGTGYGKSRQGFFTKHDVRGRDGEVIRFNFLAARKTNATNAYLQHGNLANVSKKVLKHHGKEALTTTALSYLTNDATHHVHDAAVRNAQDKIVLDARIAVIPSDKPDEFEIDKLSKELKIPEHKVISIVKGEQDVFIASCKDFYNKPGGRADTACDDVWTCFGCSNGLWTPRILPRVIKFLWFMEEQRNILTAVDWGDKFGFPYGTITQEILPRFHAHTVEWAKAEAQVLPFYVPTQMREV